MLEEKLRKADQEAEALREEQRKIEEEKARIAEAAATQAKQTEEEVSVCNLVFGTYTDCCVFCRGEKPQRPRPGLLEWPGRQRTRRRKSAA